MRYLVLVASSKKMNPWLTIDRARNKHNLKLWISIEDQYFLI